MTEKTEIRKRLLASNYTVQGALLTVWLIIMLMQASFLMYDSITQFESMVAHLAPEIPWIMLYLSFAACCEIIGLFILFTKRLWGFSLVALGELSSAILTFYPPLSPNAFSIMFSFAKLSILYFLLFTKGGSIFSYKKSVQNPSISSSQFIGIVASICLILAAILAGNTIQHVSTPNTTPTLQYTPPPLQHTPITIPSITPFPHITYIP